MIKLTFCLRRLPNLSLDAFQTYWRDTHAPLVRSHAETLKIRRYVQTHARPGPMSDAIRSSRDAPEPFDGVAELWWDDWAALESLGDDEAARAAGLELLEYNEENVVVA